MCLYRCVIQRLLPYTQYEQSTTRRGGVVGTLRNCCFDYGKTPVLASVICGQSVCWRNACKEHFHISHILIRYAFLSIQPIMSGCLVMRWIFYLFFYYHWLDQRSSPRKRMKVMLFKSDLNPTGSSTSYAFC